MSALAISAVVNHVDLLAHILERIECIKTLLATRQVSSFWRAAVAKAVVGEAVLSLAKGLLRKNIRLSEFLLDQRSKPVSYQEESAFTDLSTLSRWIESGFENGLSSLIYTEQGTSVRRDVVAALRYVQREGVYRPFVVIAPPSALVLWRSELDRVGLHYTEMATHDERHAWLADYERAYMVWAQAGYDYRRVDKHEVTMDKQLLLWSTARTVPHFMFHDVRWSNVVVDTGTSHGACITQAMMIARRFSLIYEAKPRWMRPSVVAVTQGVEPSGMHQLLLLSYAFGCFQGLYGEGDETDIVCCDDDKVVSADWFTAHIRAAIERYSFGDAAVQRWAVDEFVPEQLRAVLRPVVRAVRAE